MASYNWGERRVIERLRKMPLNPRDRNFWTLLAQYVCFEHTWSGDCCVP
jgi:hypothetical protein